ncbi:hypothetical protein CLF_102977 [Clonorchis sinensis]|uniref:Uncharacterized protein n=1 Tax=Clonorchis sinensis TaxID=79923 RepID=G7YNA1_CLOSI|nr:hypothetical protein CLF_102977 [Clonorchis sinensis]
MNRQLDAKLNEYELIGKPISERNLAHLYSLSQHSTDTVCHDPYGNGTSPARVFSFLLYIWYPIGYVGDIFHQWMCTKVSVVEAGSDDAYAEVDTTFRSVPKYDEILPTLDFNPRANRDHNQVSSDAIGRLLEPCAVHLFAKSKTYFCLIGQHVPTRKEQRSKPSADDFIRGWLCFNPEMWLLDRFLLPLLQADMLNSVDGAKFDIGNACSYLGFQLDSRKAALSVNRGYQRLSTSNLQRPARFAVQFSHDDHVSTFQIPVWYTGYILSKRIPVGPLKAFVSSIKPLLACSSSGDVDRFCRLNFQWNGPSLGYCQDASRHEKYFRRERCIPQGHHRYHTFRIASALAELTQCGLAKCDQGSGREVIRDSNAAIGWAERTSGRP